MLFRIVFKFQVQRSNMVQIPVIFHCKNQVQKEARDGTINS